MNDRPPQRWRWDPDNCTWESVMTDGQSDADILTSGGVCVWTITDDQTYQTACAEWGSLPIATKEEHGVRYCYNCEKRIEIDDRRTS